MNNQKETSNIPICYSSDLQAIDPYQLTNYTQMNTAISLAVSEEAKTRSDADSNL